MTTMAATVKNIRRILQDEPLSDTLAQAIVSASDITMEVTDVTKHSVGNWWEFDDDTGDIVLETAVDSATSVVSIRRSYLGSTAVVHSDESPMVKQPRFKYDLIAQAVNSVLDADLYNEGIFDLVEHQVLSSNTTNYYNAPTTLCLEFKDVYQKTATMVEPRRGVLKWTPKPTNADTSLYSNGKYFILQNNYGVAGVDLYYVTCAHRHTVDSLTVGAEKIVQYTAVAYLLEWTEPRRLAGPTDQGDRSVRPGAALPTAAYFRALAEEEIQKELRLIRDLYPEMRRFVRA